jgi:hypothetical protein
VDSTTQILTILIVLTAGALNLILTQFARRGAARGKVFSVRALPSMEAVPGLIGQSIESGRPVHVSMGSAGIGGLNTPAALASAALFYRVAERTATGSVAPLLTMSEAAALPLAYGTLRRAYAARGRIDRYELRSVRWFPGGDRSLAFAAGLTIMAGNEQVSGSLLTGSYGSELALILFSAQRRRHITIAGSDQLAGAAVAYAMADHALLGEEIYAAPAYLSAAAPAGDAAQRASLLTADTLRWLLIAGLLLGMFLAIREPLWAGVGRLLGGGG